MKKFLLTAALLLTAAPAMAQTYTLEARGSVMTDYRVRGISRSDEQPALQGGVELNVPISVPMNSAHVIAGAQATTVDLNADNDANVEGVLFAGLGGDYAGIQLEGKLNYNAYPGSDDDDLDYWEVVITGDYDFGPFVGGLTWASSPSYFNDSGMSFYYGADVAVPLYIADYDITARGHMGFQFIDDEENYTEDYTDWSLGLWYNWAQYDVDFGLEYTDTDLDDDECIESCGAQAVLTATKAFSW
jgi:uncharacterized protein (TIGR02001 family)